LRRRGATSDATFAKTRVVPLRFGVDDGASVRNELRLGRDG
jgi:hypothetical protein